MSSLLLFEGPTSPKFKLYYSCTHAPYLFTYYYFLPARSAPELWLDLAELAGLPADYPRECIHHLAVTEMHMQPPPLADPEPETAAEAELQTMEHRQGRSVS